MYKLGTELWGKHGKGLLVSGGCGPSGAVAIPPHIFDEIRLLKEETGLLINLHCGLVGEKTASSISRSGVDKVSFDLVYDDETIQSVLHLDRRKEHFLDTMMMLIEKGVDVVPHILAGLNRGRISWEHDAIDVLTGMDIDTVVLLILIPTRGTPFEAYDPPPVNDIMDLAIRMRRDLKGRLVLGCMRPKRSSDLEIKLIKAGFDGVVLPGKATLRWLVSQGHTIDEKGVCCCID